MPGMLKHDSRYLVLAGMRGSVTFATPQNTGYFFSSDAASVPMWNKATHFPFRFTQTDE